MNSTELLCPVYAITDPSLLSGKQLLAGVEAALAGGITTVQYRHKTASDAQKLDEASLLVELCRNYDADLIINDDAPLAHQVRAQGVHLGQGDGSVAEVRARLGPGAIIGVTCHNDLNLAITAKQHGASYVAFGRFYPSATKPGARAADLTVLGQAAELGLPVVAIGGIDGARLLEIKHHGAHSAAVCNSLFASSDIRKTAENLLNIWNGY